MYKKVIEVLRSDINVRNAQKKYWKEQPAQKNIDVLNAIYEILNKNPIYKKPHAILIFRTNAQNKVQLSPYALNIWLNYEVNKGTNNKQGLSLLNVLKLQACRRGQSISSTTPTNNINVV